MSAQSLVPRSVVAAAGAAAVAILFGLATVSADDVVVSSITPAAGPPAGGDQITITGTGFTPGSGVFLGGTRAVDAVFLNSTSIVAKTPAAGGPGTVTVTVNTDNGSGALNDGYRYVAPIAFTDLPLVAGSTIVKAQHVTELRQAVDRVSFLAGQAEGGWTDATLTPGTTLVSAPHVLELRSHLENALAALHYPGTSYTNPSIPPATVTVQSAHITELRNRTLRVGPNCQYTLSAQAITIDATGGDTMVSVTPNLNNCDWAVSPDDGWVSTGDGGLHTGAGSFGLTIAVNGGSERTTRVWVGAQRFTVTQGAP